MERTIEQLARDPEVLRMAIVGAQALLTHLEGLAYPQPTAEIEPTPKRAYHRRKARTMSPEGRAAVSTASKKRWAKWHREHGKRAK